MEKIILLILFIFVSCKQIEYKPDINFLNSAQANSMEYLVRVNGSICKDIDNKIGLCAKRISSDRALKFKMDSRPYSYRFSLVCSSSIDSNFSVDVERNRAYEFEIDADNFSDVKSFSCTGEIFPHDREQAISAKWHIRVIVYDKNYLKREKIYKRRHKKKNYYVFGSHAKYVKLNHKDYKKKTVVWSKRSKNRGYSESERMRFNYYGY